MVYKEFILLVVEVLQRVATSCNVFYWIFGNGISVLLILSVLFHLLHTEHVIVGSYPMIFDE